MTPQPTAPAPKKKMSGCLIALLIVGGLAGLVCIGSAIAVWMAARSDAGKKIVSAIDQGVKLAQDGMNAPGAAELRRKRILRVERLRGELDRLVPDRARIARLHRP